MSQNLKTYIGLADCHGLSSFLADESSVVSTRLGASIFGEEGAEKKSQERNQMIWGMQMSATANAQRRTVVYQAKVTSEVADEIEDLMKDGENLDALILLKSKANEIGLLQGVPNAKKFWEQIPNPDFDPFH